jgi:two-component system, NtrC family, sensor kinase
VKLSGFAAAMRNAPIKRKLMIVSMLTSSVVVVLACIAFISYEMLTFRRTMVNDLVSTAKIIGHNSAAAMSFDDPGSAEQTLSSLGALPHIVGAAIYDKDGVPFAKFERSGNLALFPTPELGPDGHRFGEQSLGLFHAIELAGQRIGTVYIESDLEELTARLWRYGLIMALVMLTASIAAYLLSARLQRPISDPILELADVTAQVASRQDYSVRAVKHSDDELGRLIVGFNHMLSQIQARDEQLKHAQDELEQRVEERTRELEALHEQLLQSSRQAGMAEVATNVLHNVGNVLNSVNVSASVIKRTLRTSKASGLSRAVDLLKDNAGRLAEFLGEDSRGQHLPDYLDKLAQTLAEEQKGIVEEIDRLTKSIDHIADIVATQQTHAVSSSMAEPVRVNELVDDALRMNAGGLHRHHVVVVTDVAGLPPMLLDRHRVVQILVNLISNAKQAMNAVPDRPHELRVAARIVDDRTVQVSVADNGEGISRENLTRIFAHGFTTRKTGHGFGLHSAALAAKDMGGTLTASSDGPGSGAQFVLELPLRTTKEGE